MRALGSRALAGTNPAGVLHLPPSHSWQIPGRPLWSGAHSPVPAPQLVLVHDILSKTQLGFFETWSFSFPSAQ